MAYSQGSIITAADYNNFANGSGQINAFWATGSGNAGWGQPALGTVSQTGLVTAGQWSTMVNYVNSAAAHTGQTGVGVAGSTITPGTQANYLSGLSTAINNVYSNRLVYNGGSTTNGPSSAIQQNVNVANTVNAITWSFSRSVTFATYNSIGAGDCARYFFNAGGQIALISGTPVNNGGTNRGADFLTMINSLGNISWFRQATNSGRSGTGQTESQNTNVGYWNLPATGTFNAGTQIISITSTGYPYIGDTLTVSVRTNGTNVSGNGDNGSVITFDFVVTSAARPVYYTGAGYGGAGAISSDAINVTWPQQIAITPPESTNLTTNSWGTPNGTITVA